ncbi:hypothetical protein N7508_006060 [Penicillium antarcticum]|uniref:uncharacterized protein n=1 Tax=Penicillium antarcticum TaxID=416450 RepID=UPI0023900FDC|nr:uncharacterized protein N7508_006060 [Penicillium antarcticum]KAJ5307045.1 hypothetical protein N7508_006060 [Penicillium antarcticum]
MVKIVSPCMSDNQLRQQHADGRQIETSGPNSQRDSTQGDSELGTKFLKREFGYLATFPFSVSISGLFATCMTTMFCPRKVGGSSAVVWCRVISGASYMCIALEFPFRCPDQCSVAKLLSAYPTSGGLYFTTSRLAFEIWPLYRLINPRVLKIFFAYNCRLTGWLDLPGRIASVASSEYSAAEMLLAAVDEQGLQLYD